MAMFESTSTLFLLFFFLNTTSQLSAAVDAAKLSPSETKTLLRIKTLLENPPSLSGWTNSTDFCSLPSSPSLTISCYRFRLTNLAIYGGPIAANSLSPSFSVDSLFTALSRLPNLTSLSLVSLGIWGPLPSSIARLTELRVLNLSFNDLYGAIPFEISSMSKLQRFDVSSNRIIGTIPPFLFSLPSIMYLDLSGNALAGDLPSNMSFATGLVYIDISNNLISGDLPSSLAGGNLSRVVVIDARNCSTASSCNRSVTIPPKSANSNPKPTEKNQQLVLIFAIVGGTLVVAAVLGAIFFFFFRNRGKMQISFGENTARRRSFRRPSIQVSPRTPTDARHMSQAVRIGAMGIKAYRAFAMEELEEATNNFDPSNLIDDGLPGGTYRGWLRDGTEVRIRSMKLEQRLAPRGLAKYTEVIAKLRHRHLVSILGHCAATAAGGDLLFLVFEHVSNGTLRSHLTEWRKREMLKWPQRVMAAIGVARGIQFLHTVMVPGISGNDLRMDKILLDETLMAKIENYNIPAPFLGKNMAGADISFHAFAADAHVACNTLSLEQREKEDVYQLGVILQEIITGKPAETLSDLHKIKLEFQEAVDDVSPAKRREVSDPSIHGTFADDSLRTVMEVVLNCLSEDYKERPSIDDVLWNLQYSVQVQDGRQGWGSMDTLSIVST